MRLRMSDRPIRRSATLGAEPGEDALGAGGQVDLRLPTELILGTGDRQCDPIELSEPGRLVDGRGTDAGRRGHRGVEVVHGRLIGGADVDDAAPPLGRPYERVDDVV